MTQTKNRGGRPAFEPTDEQRRTVRAMVAYGVPLDEVAQAIGITRPTLAKHFRQEIDTAATEANSKVAQSLFRKATADGVSGPSVTAAIFWLKCRAGWREAQDGPGKKEQRQSEAQNAGQGSEWGEDLHPGSDAVN